MSLVQSIDGIPAYTTTAEALAWASQYGITSYHTHVIAGEIAYMGGSTHDEITSAIRSGSGPVSRSSSSSSSSSGGGGGY
tara:strand:+ start:1007 stop:1246 length:240 start_codon:yes stop_codon:yes gene_type:complete